MAKDETVIEVSGLQLSNNTFSASPPGSLLQAEECVMPQKGVIEPRRGQSRADTLPSASALPFGMCEFDGHVLVNYGTSKTDTSYGLGYVDGSALSVYSGSPYNPVDDDGSETSYGRMKFGFAAQFLHFCTTSGPKALEAYNGTPRAAGLLRMPDAIATMTSAANLGANGVGLPYGYSRAYRTVLRKTTSSGVSLLSPPSGRQVVQNRILAPIGGMVRLANVVTVTLPGTTKPGLQVADTFTIDPGEANFPATLETVASVTGNVITYADVAVNATNTVAQDLDTGPRPVVVLAILSSDATTSTPVRIYRSLDIDGTEPGDEMFLVAEVYPTAGEITAGAVTFLDITPEFALDDPLYTNPLTGEGSAQANFAPPIYRDTTNWSERQIYADTTSLQQLRIQMLGVGSPDGIQNNDTITIDGNVFTFKTVGGGLAEVQIVSNGTPSFNVQQTAQNLVQAIYSYFGLGGVPIRAYYESTQTGAPGKILLEATSHSQGEFAVRASRVASWTPALKAAVDTDSVAERVPNGFAYSKPGQPESVPTVNYGAVGSKNYALGRILGLQQATLAFKEGDGIYAISGAAPFTVQQISTANIIAKDAACVCADAAWVYTDQGVLRVSDSGGASVVSRQIETELQRLLALMPDETRDYSFMIPYETERRVLLFVPFDDGSVGPSLRAFCYNIATQSWTGPLYADVFGGVVSSTDDGFLDKRLYLGVYDEEFATSRITVERNGQTPAYKNYVDGALTASIVTIDTDDQGVTVLELASTTGLSDGDLITQSSLESIFIMRPDLGAKWIEPLSEQPWTVAACAIGLHYDVTVQFQPQGAPASRKTLTRLAWLFKPEWFQSPLAYTLMMTDQVQANLELDSHFVGFGSNPFGVGPFGDPTPLVYDVNPITAAWTTAGQFFPGFTMPIAWSKLKLQGLVLRLETADAPAGRGK